MKINKTINGKSYKVTYSPIPQKKLYQRNQPNQQVQLTQSSNPAALSDVTFMIPIRIESEDRKKCLTIVIDYLLRYFSSTNIILCEEGPGAIFPSMRKAEWEGRVQYIYRKTNSASFHKTMNLNKMIRESNTPIVAAYDSDVIFRPHQYVNAAKAIRNGELDFCYPFNQPNYNIPKNLHPVLEASLDISSVEQDLKFVHPDPPPGGCFFMNKQKFITAGMENENFVSWGPEDQERRDRLAILGYRVGSIPGKLFHIDHNRTENSHNGNPFFDKNVQEYEKIKLMNPNELRNYISTWNWAK